MVSESLQCVGRVEKFVYLEGVSISVNANKKTLHGALLAFLADNLAAYYCGIMVLERAS